MQSKTNSQKKRFTLISNCYRIIKLIWAYDKKYIPIEVTLTLIKSLLPFVLAWYSALFINKITEGNLTGIFDPSIIWIVGVYLVIRLIIGMAHVWYQYFFNPFLIVNDLIHYISDILFCFKIFCDDFFGNFDSFS